jgi:uncharacterized protein YutE (UPF0331/DUF86 family)
MDKLVIENKIESLRKCIVRIEQRRPDTIESLLHDIDAQDVLVLNLSRAVQLCVDIAVHILSNRDQSIPETMGQAFSELSSMGIISGELSANLRNAVGFRNVAVHNYQDIDWNIVYSIAHEQLPDFKLFAQRIMECFDT